MYPQLRMLATVTLLLLPWHFSLAQSVSDVALPEVLSIALQRASGTAQLSSSPRYQASGWLAALPSVSLTYLDSDERYGVDETGASLNLPIKGATQRRADRALGELAVQAGLITDEVRGLYFSGLIREAVWSHRLAQLRVDYTVRKQNVLQQLEDRYQDLLAANATSEYALLLIQKEQVDARISEQDYQREARQWLQQYRRITGLGTMPTELAEAAAPVAIGLALEQHPGLRQLELGWLQQQQLLLANSPQARPWNLALTAKNLDSPEFEENQFGLSVEIPLTFLRIANQSGNSAWLDKSREYALLQDQLSEQLMGRWDGLRNKAQTLRNKQALLLRSSELSGRIVKQMKQLQDSNEVAQDIALRRILEALDTEAAVAVNRVLIEQNNAMLRQASGIPL